MDFQQRFKGKISLMTKEGIQGQANTFTNEHKSYNFQQNTNQSLISKQLLQIKQSLNPQIAQKVYLDHESLMNIQFPQNISHFNKHAEQIICNTHYLNQKIMNDQKRGYTADNDILKKEKLNRNIQQRSLNYLPYTYKDYQNIQQKVNKSGGLGANINTDEWNHKKYKIQRIQDFSYQIQLKNKQQQFNQKIILSERQKLQYPQQNNFKHQEFIQYLETIKNDKQY